MQVFKCLQKVLAVNIIFYANKMAILFVVFNIKLVEMVSVCVSVHYNIFLAHFYNTVIILITVIILVTIIVI